MADGEEDSGLGGFTFRPDPSMAEDTIAFVDSTGQVLASVIGLESGNVEPVLPSNGDLFFDTSNQTFKEYNANRGLWEEVNSVEVAESLAKEFIPVTTTWENAMEAVHREMMSTGMEYHEIMRALVAITGKSPLTPTDVFEGIDKINEFIGILDRKFPAVRKIRI